MQTRIWVIGIERNTQNTFGHILAVGNPGVTVMNVEHRPLRDRPSVSNLYRTYTQGERLIHTRMYVGSSHFFGAKILNFNIFGSFQKNDYFWGLKILWIFYLFIYLFFFFFIFFFFFWGGGVITKWFIFRDHFYVF